MLIKNADTLPPGGLLPDHKVNKRINVNRGHDKKIIRLNNRIYGYEKTKSAYQGDIHKPGSNKK